MLIPLQRIGVSFDVPRSTAPTALTNYPARNDFSSFLDDDRSRRVERLELTHQRRGWSAARVTEKVIVRSAIETKVYRVRDKKVNV